MSLGINPASTTKKVDFKSKQQTKQSSTKPQNNMESRIPRDQTIIGSDEKRGNKEDASSTSETESEPMELDIEPIRTKPITLDSLHKEQVPNVNGNFDQNGVFHEWHQPYSIPSINGELLHILPYTVIDF